MSVRTLPAGFKDTDLCNIFSLGENKNKIQQEPFTANSIVKHYSENKEQFSELSHFIGGMGEFTHTIILK